MIKVLFFVYIKCYNQSAKVLLLAAYVSSCDLECSSMPCPLFDGLCWEPLIISVHILLCVCHLLSYRSVPFWVNIQELRTLCSIDTGAWAEVWLEQILGQIYPEAFLSTCIPTRFLGAPRRLQWQKNGFSSDSAAASANNFILKCNKQERWASALTYMVGFTAGNSVLFAILNSWLVLWAVCGRPPITDGIDELVLKRVYEAGESVTLSCEQGYTPSTLNPRRITCTATGEWTQSDLACSREFNENSIPPLTNNLQI